MVQASAPESVSAASLRDVSYAEPALGLAALLFIVLIAFLAIYMQSPPRTVPASAPATEFSSERALQKLKIISLKKHPIGSQEHSEVREFLLKELAAIGLEPEIQRVTSFNEKWGLPLRTGTVENLVARIEGTNPEEAVLLVSHYDSVPNSFGASDDGAGVAAMLEAARALKSGPPLRNSIIFLFTDGEEVGLLGAKAFINQHRWSKNVGLVLNFEARGNTGPAFMFETSAGNGALIRELAKAAPFPLANSLSNDIYKRLPNDTDLSAFKDAGFSGFNFANIDDLAHYHTPLDSFTNVDEGTLQHKGSNALALARHFGNSELKLAKEPDAIYFNPLGYTLISYPSSWLIPLALLCVLLFVAVFVYGFRRGELSAGGITWGMLAFLLSLITSALVIWGLRLLLKTWQGDYEEFPWNQSYNNKLYLLAFVALTAAIVSALYNWFRRKASVRNLAAGALVWWLCLMLFSVFKLMGGSYLLTWPLFFALIGFGLTFNTSRQNSLKSLIVLSLCAIPGIVLLVPMIYQASLALTLDASAALMVPVVLLLGLLIPQIEKLADSNRWALPLLLCVFSLGALVLAVSTDGFNARRPKVNNIFYGLDADTGAAFWASPDRKADEWTSQFLTKNPERGLIAVYPMSSREFLQSRAPSSSLTAPELVLLEEIKKDAMRTLRLRLISPRQAPIISLYTDSGRSLLGANINNQNIDVGAPSISPGANGLWGLHYFALPKEGVELILQFQSTQQPLRLRVEDRSYGLPEITGTTFRARPDGMMPASTPYSETTVVGKTFTF